MAMEAFEADPLPTGLPHAEAAICRAAEQVAGGPPGVWGVEGEGRDGTVPWAHQEAQILIGLQTQPHCSLLLSKVAGALMISHASPASLFACNPRYLHLLP